MNAEYLRDVLSQTGTLNDTDVEYGQISRVVEAVIASLPADMILAATETKFHGASYGTTIRRMKSIIAARRPHWTVNE